MKKLSKRESKVLSLIKDGMKNKDIAKSLGLSEKSIGTYVLRIYNKIGLSMEKNRYALVVLAIKKGLLKSKQ